MKKETVQFHVIELETIRAIKYPALINKEQKARYESARDALDRIFDKGSRHLEEAVIAQLDYAASRKCSAASDKERDLRERREAR